jgi:PGM1 C-terminal domain
MRDAEFTALQSKLRAFWPQITLRSIGDIERVVVVAHSVPAGLPDHLVPVFPAYEERFLCLVLSLLRAPRSRVVYVKHYAATDHLDNPAYSSLTPDDLLDIVQDRNLGWDRERETGVVFHMVSALAVAGRIGLTAIGDTLEEARRSYYAVKAAVDEAAGVAAP